MNLHEITQWVAERLSPEQRDYVETAGLPEWSGEQTLRAICAQRLREKGRNIPDEATADLDAALRNEERHLAE